MTFMRPHDAEFLKQTIRDQIAPLKERIEKLEAEIAELRKAQQGASR